MPLRLPFAAAVALLATIAAFSAFAQQHQFRSGLPLFTDADELWPRSFFDEDSFGCETILIPGDYLGSLDPVNAEPVWWRVANYGVMHCAMVFASGFGRDSLTAAQIGFAWLAPLGEVEGPIGEDLELFAFQIRWRGGIEYLFLARDRDGDNRSWIMLDPECPAGALRESEPIDVWGTRFCELGDAATAHSIAQDAVQREPAATFRWAGRYPHP